MRRLYKITIFLLAFLHTLSLAGEKYLEIRQDSPNAEKAVQSAVNQVSDALVKKFIGSLKLEEQKKQIQKTVLAFSNRYILYTKTAAPQKTAEGLFIVPVTIGFSEENFKQILLKEGIFYTQFSNLRILPLILFEDRVNNEFYGWWFEKNNSFSKNSSKLASIYNALQNKLMSYGFYLINPEFVRIRDFIPENLWFKRPKKKHVFNLARFFRAHLVLTGFIKLRTTGVDSLLNLNMEMGIYHTESGRLLAEIKHLKKIAKEEKPSLLKAVDFFLSTQKNFGENLGLQLQSVYETGQISSHLLKITVRGKLNYQNFQNFKSQLMSKIPSITDLTENIIRDQAITYIASTNTSLDVVSTNMDRLSLSDFEVRISRIKRNEITLKVATKK